MSEAGVEHGVDPSELDEVVRSAPKPVRPEEVSAELIFSDAVASATVGIWRFSAED